MDIKDNEVIGLKSIIVGYLLQWRLFLAVFIFSIIPAVLYLIFYPRTYEIKASIQIQEDKELGGGSFGLGEAAGLMKSFGLGSVSGGAVNIEDEMMTLTSNKLLREMILELGVNVDYCKPFSLLRMYEKVPLVMTADSVTNACLSEDVDFIVVSKGGNWDVSAETKTMDKKSFHFTSLPAVIDLPLGTFVLNYKGDKEPIAFDKLNITYRPASWVAEEVADEFFIEEVSKTSNVIELGCTDYEKKRGVDMLNCLVKKYNEQADFYKKDEATKTLSFLDGRIQGIVTDLADIEEKIEAYKRKHKLMDLEHDVEFYVEQMKELQARLIELEAQQNVIDMMDDFVKDPANKYNLVPVLMNAQEGEKGSPLITYNEVLLERARVIQNSNIQNPLVATLSEQADQLRLSVFETIGNARKGLQLSIADIKQKEKQIYDKMNSYPVAEREYIELRRQQEIVQGVYLILLQKREENALILGQVREKAKIVDDAYVKNRPIGPRKLYALLGMLALTLVVPIGYLACKNLLSSLLDEYKKRM